MSERESPEKQDQLYLAGEILTDAKKWNGIKSPLNLLLELPKKHNAFVQLNMKMTMIGIVAGLNLPEQMVLSGTFQQAFYELVEDQVPMHTIVKPMKENERDKQDKEIERRISTFAERLHNDIPTGTVADHTRGLRRAKQSGIELAHLVFDASNNNTTPVDMLREYTRLAESIKARRVEGVTGRTFLSEYVAHEEPPTKKSGRRTRPLRLDH